MTARNANEPPRNDQPAKGSRPGDLRIRRIRREQPSIFGKLTSRLLRALPR